MDLARLLLRTGKPLFLAVNKIDTVGMDAAAENFRRLGIRNLIAISAEHGNNIGDLLDEVFAVLPPPEILRTPRSRIPEAEPEAESEFPVESAEEAVPTIAASP